MRFKADEENGFRFIQQEVEQFESASMSARSVA